MPFRTSPIVPTVIALTVWCSSAQPTSAHEGRGQEEQILETEGPPGNLRGPWMRNAELSEDPIARIASVWPEPELVPRVLRESTEGLDDRLATVLIKFSGDLLTVLDGRGEFRSFSPEEVGDRLRRRLRSASPYATLTGDGFRIERYIVGWTWSDDFTRQGDQLVRTTTILGGSARTLDIRTVYNPVGDEHPAARAAGIANPSARAAVIRILPPGREYRELLSGRVEIRTLVTHPGIRTVEFLLDGTPAQRKRRRPFRARLDLADPPREQTLEVRAYDAEGRLAAGDRMILNRIETPFGVRITALRGEEVDGEPAVRVAADVSLPRAAVLESVDFYRSEDLLVGRGDFHSGPNAGATRAISVEALVRNVSASDFVRVRARLADGRELEDAQLLQGADYQDEIDVQLVQLQVLVVDDRGSPVSRLEPDDFEIREGGARLSVEALYTATDVPLALGFALDSSESMLPIWRQLKYAATSFLDETLTHRDRAFLVDFDQSVRLLQPLTGNKGLLARWLDQVTPWGGTALSDGLLFSLLQYETNRAAVPWSWSRTAPTCTAAKGRKTPPTSRGGWGFRFTSWR